MLNAQGSLKRQKIILFMMLIGFCALETPFTIAWIHQQGGLLQVHYHFWHQIFHDPLYQVTAIDYGVTAILVFYWMMRDSLNRNHPLSPWLWLPVFLFSPALGLLGYLLTRKSAQHKMPLADV